jgi:putative ABC transport system permease protein
VITSRAVAGQDRFTLDDSGRNVIIVGKVYADRQGISPQTLGTMTFRGTVTLGSDRGLEVNDTFQVVGIYESGFVFGDNQVFLPIETFQRVFKPRVDFSEVFVTVDSVENVAQVEKGLKAILGNKGDVLPLSPIATIAAESLSSVEGNVGVVALVTVVAASVIILLLLILVTRERTREIGILQAVGASKKDVAGQFASESLVQALLGGLGGFGLYLAAGPALALLIVSPLGSGARTVSGVHGENPIPAILSTTSFGASAEFLGIALGIAVLTALLGTLYAVLRAIRLRPVEAIRG